MYQLLAHQLFALEQQEREQQARTDRLVRVAVRARRRNRHARRESQALHRAVSAVLAETEAEQPRPAVPTVR